MLYHWPEVYHNWGKVVVIVLIVFQGIQGKKILLIAHSQRIALERRNQPPAQLIYLSEANPLLRSVFSACTSMKCPIKNRLIEVYFTIPDFYIVTTIRIGTHPGFVVNRRPLTTKVR